MAGIKRTGKLMGAPRYTIGDIIDISYKQTGGLPDRIEIIGIKAMGADGIAAPTSDGNNMWMYSAISELCGGGVVQFSEKYLNTYTINYNLPCYKVPQIQYMYGRGFRFCGNFTSDTVEKSMCDIIDGSDFIERIVACNAYDKSGCFDTSREKQAIWVRYRRPFDLKDEFAPDFTKDISGDSISRLRNRSVYK